MRAFPLKMSRFILFLFVMAVTASPDTWANERSLCLDGFCIGDGISNVRFDSVDWIIPNQGLTKEKCTGVGCQPEVAFRGYPTVYQAKLADALRLKYGLMDYNIITNNNIGVLRHYQYECNRSARDIGGERRFLGAYRSTPSHYLTVVGLRLIGHELKIYRIARQYSYHTPGELTFLARHLSHDYGGELLLYNYLSSNAYSDVISQHKDGWFGRSTMFNPSDLSDNAAELVLIDPNTRVFLLPSSMPESGEIKPLPMKLSEQCNRSLPIQ